MSVAARRSHPETAGELENSMFGRSPDPLRRVVPWRDTSGAAEEGSAASGSQRRRRLITVPLCRPTAALRVSPSVTPLYTSKGKKVVSTLIHIYTEPDSRRATHSH
ncbi:hypothetical protein SKAU_G00121980 [Synaphobranchus kaupii]|uniref:Uncharacterized protein n=1 Tax=Synaphobranchus kaupii TaxID=118154 RepID=A0A9Q1FNV3_SYNKA|nr:hypothetical protein SKAU_G00121980 [Synaphobranchus kaupii]